MNSPQQSSLLLELMIFLWCLSAPSGQVLSKKKHKKKGPQEQIMRAKTKHINDDEVSIYLIKGCFYGMLWFIPNFSRLWKKKTHVLSGVMFTAVPELINTPDYCRIIWRRIECPASNRRSKNMLFWSQKYLQGQKDICSNNYQLLTSVGPFLPTSLHPFQQII